jgi:hypothetical protein
MEGVSPVGSNKDLWYLVKLWPVNPRNRRPISSSFEVHLLKEFFCLAALLEFLVPCIPDFKGIKVELGRHEAWWDIVKGAEAFHRSRGTGSLFCHGVCPFISGVVLASLPCCGWGRPTEVFLGPRAGSHVFTSKRGCLATPDGPALDGAGSGDGPLLGLLGSRPLCAPRGGEGSRRGARRSNRAVVTQTGETDTILWSFSILVSFQVFVQVRQIK